MCSALPSAGDVQENYLKAQASAMLGHLYGGPGDLGDPVRKALGRELLGLWEPPRLHGSALLPSSLLA